MLVLLSFCSCYVKQLNYTILSLGLKEKAWCKICCVTLVMGIVGDKQDWFIVLVFVVGVAVCVVLIMA